MGESSEGPPRSLVSKVREGVRTVVHVAGKLYRPFSVEPPEITLEEIDEKSVANVIINFVNNPVREKLGLDKWENGFTIADVMFNMGYGVNFWGATDYRE